MTNREQEIAHLQRLQAKHRKNIHTLEETLANYGMDRPLSLLNELEFEQEQLHLVEERLVELAAQVRTEEVPSAPAEPPRPPREVLPRVTVPEPKVILIPAGEFLMGSDPNVDENATDREQPQHTLSLPDYYLARTPVTNSQYAVFVQDTGHKPPCHWEGDLYPEELHNHPVVNVSWSDAVAYCKWLSKKTGKPYRLPSEAEWEKAARGADGWRFPWGDEWDVSKCNTREGGPGTTTPVGQYSPDGDSPYGVTDMAGNVWEWCADWLKAYPGNPFPAEDYGETHKVLRGSSWETYRLAHCAFRYARRPDDPSNDIGFRCAKSSPRAPAKTRQPVNWEKVGPIAQVIALLIAVIGVPIALGTWLWPNAADFIFARPSETPTVTTTSSPTHTPVISTATGTATATPTNTPTDTPVPPPPIPLPPTDTPTPTLLLEPGDTLMPVQGYALPLTEPWDVIYDGSELWVLFQSRLVKLGLVEAEGRFRAAQQQDFPSVNSLTWDASRDAYWTVRGAPWWLGEEIDLIDRAGNRTATFIIPQTFVSYPRFVAWDGEYLWVTSDAGTLYKLQPASDSGELREIDSYAPAIERYGLHTASGLTWNGNHLWLLVGDVLSKLNWAAQPICRIELPSGYPQPSWDHWQGLAWDGQFLWVAHRDADKVYRVDPNTCR